ncbi:FG-GAP repeat domain-containing protein [Anthocerotibacter panamensis]|uniref:FG-GAP repeat domain-containing protein n=1 Tax=Anthocerotibacter panamensis TaxID=2857077 RepID=UPI001FDA1454|nr:VCBS repeat-containing protein [Anthocerotibacter panamensis]
MYCSVSWVCRQGSVIATVDGASLQVKTGYGYTPFGQLVRTTLPVTLNGNTDWTGLSYTSYTGNKGNYFADGDGDGKADAIVSNDQNTGAPGLIGSRSTHFADVDGDGRADALAVNTDGLTVRRSTGSSFGPIEVLKLGAFTTGDRGNFFADVTGEGRADALVANTTQPIFVSTSEPATNTNAPALGENNLTFTGREDDGTGYFTTALAITALSCSALSHKTPWVLVGATPTSIAMWVMRPMSPWTPVASSKPQ